MADPRNLGPGAVRTPPPAAVEAEIFDEATEPGQSVRCVRPLVDPLTATNPMPWWPYVTGGGVFYPKRGDRAILLYPADGPPVISQWWPASETPDVAF
jgi:hypothetical protein